MKKDDDSILELTKRYQQAAEAVHVAVQKTDAKSMHEYAVKVTEKIGKIEVALVDYNREWTAENIGKAGKSYTSYRHVTDGKKTTKLKTDVKKFLTAHDIPKSPQEFAEHTFIELSEQVTKASESVKELVNEAVAGQRQNLNQVKDLIEEKMSAEGVLNVRYKDGKQVPLDVYAAMLSRSARIETANVESFKALLGDGGDLVRCTTISPTCDLCAMYQGRVYSVSGRDKRFPALYETALKHGYSLIHPNCRHEFIPFVEELYTKEEIDKLIKHSNRPFKDSRSQAERDAYARQQGQLRQYREEYKEYERWKAALGDKMPYKSLGAFRRGRRAQSETYKKAKTLYKSLHQKTPKKRVLPKEPAPVKIKYTTTKEAFAKISLSGIEENFAKKIDQRLLDLANKYPLLNTNLTIKTTVNSNIFGQYRWGFKAKDNRLESIKQISFSKKNMPDEFTSSELHKSEAKHRKAKNTSALSTIDHEYAHAMDLDYLFKQSPELHKEYLELDGVDVNYSNVARANSLMRSLNHSDHDLSSTLKRKLQEKYKLDEKQFFAKVNEELGSYAASHTKEFLAEAFSAYRNLPKEEHTDFLKTVGSMVEELYKEMGNGTDQ